MADHVRGIPVVKPIETVLSSFRFQSASGFQNIGSAFRSQIPEGNLDAELRILREKGTVNAVDNLLAVFLPPGIRHLPGDFLDLPSDTKPCPDSMPLFQHGGNYVRIPFCQCPRVGRPGILTGAGVRNIK